jgi:sporulation protein YlmC with PRC-barrel domain
MNIRMMLLGSVAAVAMAPVAFAQETTTDPLLPPAQEQMPAEQAPMDSETIQNEPADSDPAATDPGVTDPTITDPATTQAPVQAPVEPNVGDEAVGDIAIDPSVTPPPAEAIIQAQRPNEMRSENLIGATVFDGQGEEVGKIKDILFDTSGTATGVVLSVGGILGVGAKEVGLNWEEIDVRPQPELVRVNYTKEQLEAVPAFKTQETLDAESQANAPVGGTITPEPAPEPATPAPTE